MKERRSADLLLEVTDSIVVGVCEKVVDSGERLSDVVLEMVHQMRTVTLTPPRSKGQHAFLAWKISRLGRDEP
jgi:hypothetical protein